MHKTLKHILAMMSLLFAATMSATNPMATPEAMSADGNTDMVRDRFINAPLTIFPTIDKNTRLDMLDYYDNGMYDKYLKNRMGGSTRVINVQPQRIWIETSDVSKVQIALLPMKSVNDTILLLVNTVYTSNTDSTAGDSSVNLYNRHWKELNLNLFTPPTLANWVKSEYKSQMADIENKLPFLMTEATIIVSDPSSTTNSTKLQLKPQLGDYVSIDDLTWLEKVLKPNLTYEWNGKKFVAAKP